MFFSDYLDQKCSSQALKSILLDLAVVIQKIAKALQLPQEGYAGTQNVFGENQVKMDVLSQQLFVDILKDNAAVAFIGSEELGEPLRKESNDPYAVVFDPLDGSSLMDTHLAVGSIIGVYQGSEVLGKKGRDQVASVVAVYGSSLAFFLTWGEGVDEFIFDFEQGVFVLAHEKLQLAPTAKIFAPGNLKVCKSEKWYFSLLKKWLDQGYILRYSGSMAPDVCQILKKGGGIFTYPGSAEQPEGKLRLLYECAPMAFLVEQAGGKAVSLTADILDIPIQSYQQQSPLLIGSSEEVAMALAEHFANSHR